MINWTISQINCMFAKKMQWSSSEMKKLLKRGKKTQDIDIKMCKYLIKTLKKHKKQRKKSFNIMI